MKKALPMLASLILLGGALSLEAASPGSQAKAPTTASAAPTPP